MTVHALTDSKEYWHLVADIPALFPIAGLLAVLMPPEKARREGVAQTWRRT